jgi:cystathionine gamma-synthase
LWLKDFTTKAQRARRSTKMKRETICATGGGAHDAATGGVAPALQPSTTYLRGADNRLTVEENFYSRYGAPNVYAAERAIAQLEGAAEARLFASGMAAALAVFRRLAPGTHVVSTSRGYFSIIAWLREQSERGALQVDFFDPRAPETMAGLLRRGLTKLVWIETPVNPVYADAADRAWRRHRVPLGDEVSQRPFGRAGWRAGDPRCGAADLG